jgi:short-subunit dehydrogenase
LKLSSHSQPADGPPQRVFITGASSGIGQAFARYYAKQGAQLGLIARSNEALKALAAEIGPLCAIYPLDVRDAAALNQAAEDFMQRFGVPDIVIANAGVSRGTLTEHKEDTAAFRAIMEINVLGMVHTFQPFIAPMKTSPGKGRLVGIASVAGIRGLPGAEAYSASKAAVIGYLESLRIEVANYGIAVTTIAPGYIRSPMTDVNTYRMPFLMDVDIAVQKFAKAIANRRRFVIIPWQMGIVARLMRLMPAGLWDWAAKKAPHKPRLDWDWL